MLPVSVPGQNISVPGVNSDLLMERIQQSDGIRLHDAFSGLFIETNDDMRNAPLPSYLDLFVFFSCSIAGILDTISMQLAYAAVSTAFATAGASNHHDVQVYPSTLCVAFGIWKIACLYSTLRSASCTIPL